MTLVGRNDDALRAVAAELPGGATPLPSSTSATSAQVRARLRRSARKALGPIAILVNNAGQAESAPFSKTSLELWQRMLAVNLTGTFLCARAALPDMLEARRGRIVNIASTAGQVGYAYVAAYWPRSTG